MSRDKYEHITMVGSCHPQECPSCKRYERPNEDRFGELDNEPGFEELYICWYESPRVILDWDDDERYMPTWCPLKERLK